MHIVRLFLWICKKVASLWCNAWVLIWYLMFFLFCELAVKVCSFVGRCVGLYHGKNKDNELCVCFCYPSFSEPYRSSSNPLNKWNVMNIWIVQDVFCVKAMSQNTPIRLLDQPNMLGTQPHGHLGGSFSSNRQMPGWSSSHPPPAPLDKRQVLFLGSEERLDVSSQRVVSRANYTYCRVGQRNQVQLVYRGRRNRSSCLPKPSQVCSFVQSTSW